MNKINYLLLVIGYFFIFPAPVFAHSQTQVIEMTPEGFKPQVVEVDENATVIFLNKDANARWPASNVHPTHELYPEFDSRKPIEQGESWPFKSKKAGEWKYHDHLYPHMRGSITVVDEDGSNDDKKSWKQNLSDFFLQLIAKIKSLFPFSQKEEAQKSWENLKLEFKGQSGSSGDIHDQAHLAGSLLYKEKGVPGISNCSPEFAFGCYHGFLDTAFSKNLDHLQEAYEACKKLNPEGNLTGPVASCIHGIGHGVASFYQTSDLKGSLATCRKLTSGQEYCFDGVLMEFVRSAPDTFFKKDDPLYPCNKLEQEFGYTYSQACGRNQPSLLMSRFEMGFEEVIGVCSASSSKVFKKACFDALGFSLASSGDVNQIISGCQKIGIGEFITECIKSAAGELIFQEVPGWESKWREVCSASENAKQCLENGQNLIREYGRVAKIS